MSSVWCHMALLLLTLTQRLGRLDVGCRSGATSLLRCSTSNDELSTGTRLPVQPVLCRTANRNCAIPHRISGGSLQAERPALCLEGTHVSASLRPLQEAEACCERPSMQAFQD